MAHYLLDAARNRCACTTHFPGELYTPNAFPLTRGTIYRTPPKVPSNAGVRASCVRDALAASQAQRVPQLATGPEVCLACDRAACVGVFQLAPSRRASPDRKGAGAAPASPRAEVEHLVHGGGGGVALAFLSTARPHRRRQHHECTRARRLVELGDDGLVGGLAVRGVRWRELARLERLPVETPEEGVATDALRAAPRA